jgi:hypothetical protein
MEAGNHFKNEASSKSRMSRGHFFKYFGIIALTVVITVIVCSFGDTYQVERWEYQVVHSSDSAYPGSAEKALNSLGKEGWEVFSVVHSNDALVFTLKRRMR